MKNILNGRNEELFSDMLPVFIIINTFLIAITFYRTEPQDKILNFLVAIIFIYIIIACCLALIERYCINKKRKED